MLRGRLRLHRLRNRGDGLATTTSGRDLSSMCVVRIIISRESFGEAISASERTRFQTLRAFLADRVVDNKFQKTNYCVRSRTTKSAALETEHMHNKVAAGFKETPSSFFLNSELRRGLPLHADGNFGDSEWVHQKRTVHHRQRFKTSCGAADSTYERVSTCGSICLF